MLTNQQIFNIAVSGLLVQGKKSQDKAGNCFYRGPDNTKCGVGMLIKDAEYIHTIEGVGCIRPTMTLIEVLHKSNVDIHCTTTKQLLVAIQDIHDKKGVQNWPTAFQWLATDFSLDPLVITEFLLSSPRDCDAHSKVDNVLGPSSYVVHSSIDSARL